MQILQLDVDWVGDELWRHQPQKNFKALRKFSLIHKLLESVSQGLSWGIVLRGMAQWKTCQLRLSFVIASLQYGSTNFDSTCSIRWYSVPLWFFCVPLHWKALFREVFDFYSSSLLSFAVSTLFFGAYNWNYRSLGHNWSVCKLDQTRYSGRNSRCSPQVSAFKRYS